MKILINKILKDLTLKQSIIITGSGGFLGQNLVKHAILKNYNIKALIYEKNPFTAFSNVIQIKNGILII